MTYTTINQTDYWMSANPNSLSEYETNTSETSTSETDYWMSANPNSLNDSVTPEPKAPKAPIFFQNKSLTIYHFAHAKISAWHLIDPENWA